MPKPRFFTAWGGTRTKAAIVVALALASAPADAQASRAGPEARDTPRGPTFFSGCAQITDVEPFAEAALRLRVLVGRPKKPGVLRSVA